VQRAARQQQLRAARVRLQREPLRRGVGGELCERSLVRRLRKRGGAGGASALGPEKARGGGAMQVAVLRGASGGRKRARGEAAHRPQQAQRRPVSRGAGGRRVAQQHAPAGACQLTRRGARERAAAKHSDVERAATASQRRQHVRSCCAARGARRQRAAASTVYVAQRRVRARSLLSGTSLQRASCWDAVHAVLTPAAQVHEGRAARTHAHERGNTQGGVSSFETSVEFHFSRRSALRCTPHAARQHISRPAH